MEVSDKLKKYLEDEISNYCNDKKMLEIYVNYDDEISANTILQWNRDYEEYTSKPLQDGEKYIPFNEFAVNEIWEADWFDETIAMEEDSFVEEIRNNVPDDLKEELEKIDNEDLIDYMCDSLGYSGVDASKYVKDLLNNTRIRIETCFATPEEINRDLTSIDCAYNEGIDASIESFTDDNLLKDYKNCLTYLIHQQGYSVNELFDNLYENPAGFRESNLPFIESVTNEIANSYSDGLSQLVVLSGFNGNDYMDYINKLYNPEEKQKNPYLEISKDAMIGLHDSWNGATSIFEINPDKNIIIPKEYVHKILVEGLTRDERGFGGYTVDEVCGLTSDCWKENTIKDTNEKPEIVKEDNEKIVENLYKIKEKEESEER